MKIAITQRTIENQTYPETRDALGRDWTKYLNTLIPDAALLPVPNALSDVPAWLSLVQPDAVILSNGEDWTGSALRDHAETEMFSWAIQENIPLLGVCRGMQVINYLCGGSHVSSASATSTNHTDHHNVSIVDDAFVQRLGCTELSVNSYHNMIVPADSLAPTLQPFAFCEKSVEGLYAPDRRLLGVQWHVEREHNGGKLVDEMIKSYLKGNSIW